MGFHHDHNNDGSIYFTEMLAIVGDTASAYAKGRHPASADSLPFSKQHELMHAFFDQMACFGHLVPDNCSEFTPPFTAEEAAALTFDALSDLYELILDAMDRPDPEGERNLVAFGDAAELLLRELGGVHVIAATRVRVAEQMNLVTDEGTQLRWNFPLGGE